MTTDFKNRSKIKWEGTGMGTEGNGAQEPADTRAEYIPVWLTVDQLRQIKHGGSFDPEYGVRLLDEEVHSVLEDAIDWAESR